MPIFNVQVSSGNSHDNVAVRGAFTESEARRACVREGLKPTSATVDQIDEYGTRFCQRVVECYDCDADPEPTEEASCSCSRGGSAMFCDGPHA